MHKRRLLKLADLLEKDAKRKKGIKFDMSDFGSTTEGEPVLSCGTSACAFGLAAISGAFKRSGLDYRINKFGNITFRWRGQKTSPFEAAQKLFDITFMDSCRLFGQYSHLPNGGNGAVAERAVAKIIREFVAGNPY